MIQGGDYTNFDGTGGESIYGENFGYEVCDYTLNNRGAVAMAHSSMPDSNGSQFYICQQNSNWLDGQYTVFGEVTEGLDIIEKMQLVATDKNDRPLEDIRILKATVTKDLPEPEKPKAAPQKKQVKRPVRRR
jgi:cyclophilin family peptidyl-prolyl cis-trans isomerase